jgi:hypothetical protein
VSARDDLVDGLLDAVDGYLDGRKPYGLALASATAGLTAVLVLVLRQARTDEDRAELVRMVQRMIEREAERAGVTIDLLQPLNP